MSPPSQVPDAPRPAARAAPLSAAAPAAPSRPPHPPRRTRRRFWLALAAAALVSLALFPTFWQMLLRRVLVWETARHGGDLSIRRIEGGPFDTFCLYDVHCRQRGLPSGNAGRGTDLRVARVEFTPDWSFPRRRGPRRSWLQRIVLDGLTGQYDFSSLPTLAPTPAPPPSFGLTGWLGRNSSRFVPASFFVRADDFLVRRGRYHACARHLRLDADRNAAGLVLARELEIAGPGFANTFLNRHGATVWQGNHLTVKDVELAPGVRLASAMLDGTQLPARSLDWDATLAVLGGEVRAQGAVRLTGTRLGLELAGTMRQLPVQTVARLVGLVGSAGGLIEQGDFSFRGEPEDWSAAETWLAAQATNVRWGRRQWQSLDVQAVVLHRRVQVNRLELRQSRNRLSLKGEFPLPPAVAAAGKPTPGARWWEAGFSCAVTANLDDLRAFSLLVGPRFPVLDGRMSVNGALEALPGRPGIDGYLNVEGSGLTVLGAPLDFLRSTLVFQGDDLQVADLQATHEGDALSGKWTTRLAGASGYQGELRLAVRDRSIYASALGGVLDLGKIGLGSDDPTAPLNLAGTFHGPGPQGEIVFQNAGTATEPLRVTVPTVGDWWRDD